jgi:hypothetical protein
MTFRRSLIAVATAAVSLAATAPALARTSVSVRVEGATRTLLTQTTVTPPAGGSITKGGTPPGKCKANTAAGALDVATHHRWGGAYGSFGIEVNEILGTTLDDKTAYWGFFVDDRFASKGVCDTPLKPGEQLLFARVSLKTKQTPLPLVLKAPATATVGTPFTVRAFVYPGKGSATKPVAGIRFSGMHATTDAKGIATLTATHAGRLSLIGSGAGVIRSAAATVVVSR